MSKKSYPNWVTKTVAMADSMTMDEINHRMEEISNKSYFMRTEILILKNEIEKRKVKKSNPDEA